MNIKSIENLINFGEYSVNIELSVTLKVKDSVFRPGTYRIHLPAPINASWLKEGQLLDSDPMFRMASVEDFPQRSVYFNEIFTENHPFSVKYAFTSLHCLTEPDIALIDAAEQKTFTEEQIKRFSDSHHCGCESYTALPVDAVRIQDVCEENGISFSSEYSEILGKIREQSNFDIDYNITYNKKKSNTASNRGSMALSIYNYIIKNFNRMQRTDHNTAFVIMCRMCGIPARWQGGYGVSTSNVQNKQETFKGIPHDWALVHLLPYGWIYLDCNFGAEAYDKNIVISNKPLSGFFFGNIDPCLVPTASVPSGDLYPAKDYERADKVLNVNGEAEMVPDKMSSKGHYEGYGLKSDDFDTEVSIKTEDITSIFDKSIQ